jgi:hypothetical protein
MHGNELAQMTIKNRPRKNSAIKNLRLTLTDADRHKPDDPEQSKRFVEAARLAEVDEDLTAFDRAFDKLDVRAKTEKIKTRGKPTS